MDWIRRFKSWWTAVLSFTSFVGGLLYQASALMGIYLFPTDFLEQFGVPDMSPDLFIGAGVAGLLLFAWARWWPDKEGQRTRADEDRPGWHDDLWNAQEALVEYRRSLSGGDLDQHAAKQALLPHLHALSHALDEANIPHPPISNESLFLLDNQAEWGDFIARLWAVRRDIGLARNLYCDRVGFTRMRKRMGA